MNREETKEQPDAELMRVRQQSAGLEDKAAEETLGAGEWRYQQVVENSPSPIFSVGKDGLIQTWNRACEKVFQYGRDVIGQSYSMLLSTPEDQIALDAMVAQVFDERSLSNVDIALRCQDGTDRFMVSQLYPLLNADGQVDACIVANTDVTDRERSQELLRRRNRELALLNRVGQELSATLDVKQVTERLLRKVTEIAGTEGASVWLWDEEMEGWLTCGTMITLGKVLPPNGLRLGPGQGIAGWVAQRGETVVIPDVREAPRHFPGVDEQIDFKTHSLLAVPLRCRGTVLGVLEVVNKLQGEFDDNDRALVETLAASAAIAIDNARMVEELRRYSAELEASNEDLDAFAHTVAHDLNNPLTRVIGFAELLEEDYETLTDDEVRRFLHTIARSGNRMANITDELLLLSTVRNVDDIEVEPLDMDTLVSQALVRLEYLIESSQVQITLPDTWPAAMGYGPWIEEVWTNYISNAVKYGGEPPHLELGATDRGDGTIQFWVRDDGSGLTPEEQARLFTPFTRLQKLRAKGHGLGLSIVRRIMEKLGGEAGVESKLGEGSHFTFTLPAELAD
jgi:PAS domain S-box-containing protein